jgi:hypothetical protein
MSKSESNPYGSPPSFTFEISELIQGFQLGILNLPAPCRETVRALTISEAVFAWPSIESYVSFSDA